jgi:hypothetical protein
MKRIRMETPVMVSCNCPENIVDIGGVRCRRSFFDRFKGVGSLFRVFLTVFIQISEVIHGFLDGEDLC